MAQVSVLLVGASHRARPEKKAKEIRPGDVAQLTCQSVTHPSCGRLIYCVQPPTVYLTRSDSGSKKGNLPGWRWAMIKQLALVGSRSSLHSGYFKALGGSDGVGPQQNF